jgi:hypothetical protein
MLKMFDHLLAAIREFDRYEAQRRAVVQAVYAARPCNPTDYEKPAYLRRAIQVRSRRGRA